MASLYIDRRGVELRLDGQAIAFYENNIRISTIPIAPLERVFLKGDVRMHSGLPSCQLEDCRLGKPVIPSGIVWTAYPAPL